MKKGALVAQGAPDAVISEEVVSDVYGLNAKVYTDLISGTLAVSPMCGRYPSECPPLETLSKLQLILSVGGYALRYHMVGETNVMQTLRTWKTHAPHVFPLSHPSWRNTGWLKKHPWFEAELLPALRDRVQELL